MRRNEGRNSYPGQGWSRVKFPHTWYQEPKGSPTDTTLTSSMLDPVSRLGLLREHVVQVDMNPTNYREPHHPLLRMH